MKLGCNYWASNAGTEMWQQFDPAVIRNDMQILRQHGVEYLRVFPNWRDFQPVEALYGGGTTFKEYRLVGDRLPENRYFLEETMLDRFDQFCDIAEQYGMKLIVGLITGWMSGRVFTPPALDGRNMFKDTVCTHFAQLYVTGLVRRFRDKAAIYAWDHGNECQCLGGIDTFETAESWARMITNAVYANDSSRPMISGFNSVNIHSSLDIAGQADCCDIMVTHPYAFWGTHTRNDRMRYIRTELFSAAITRMYRDIGKKPCLVEEMGTMGPAICDEVYAADFLRGNYFSVLANGGDGLLWWCAHDQNHLMTPPYTWTMCENELGMITEAGEPKPVLKQMQKLAQWQASMTFTLPEADVDAVCILTRDQDTWGVGYMAYVLSKQAHMNISFANGAEKLPDAKVYMLPSVAGCENLPKHRFLELKERVRSGATLYISQDDGILSTFEELTGNRVVDSEYAPFSGTFNLNGYEIPYNGKRKLYIRSVGSQQIQTPLITRYSYGQGQVFFVNFPLEAMLIDTNRGFDNHCCEVYREIFKDTLDAHPVHISNENVVLTIHPRDGGFYVIAVNHSENVQEIAFQTDAKLVRLHYGNPEACEPMDAVVAEFHYRTEKTLFLGGQSAETKE